MAADADIPQIDCAEGLPHPALNQTLVGHPEAEEEFLSSFNGGRFHHAWLLTGPKGIGKASFAYRAAKFLISQSTGSGGGLFGPPDSLETDPENPAIKQVQSGASPNLKILRRQYDPKGKKFFSVIRVDEVRGLASFFGMKASEDGWRIVIVDTVDDMNSNAANALLKVLEEPPEKTIFFLISHAPAGLLPTIRSRCRKLQLSPLGDEDIRTALNLILPNDDRLTDPTLYALAEGSPGRAALMLQNGGLEIFGTMLEIFKSYPTYDGQLLHDLADICGRKGSEVSYDILCELYPWWISRLVRSVSMGDSASYLPGEEALFHHLVSIRPVDYWIKVWDAANKRISDSDRINLDRKQVALDLFLTATLNK
ncbi:MAG: DNA polymerase III subunit delta' [Sneathiella sp.]|nr:DNA polymerase III subunit delta' [Sneathiella sp.]